MSGLGIYRLLPLLRREAELVKMNVTAADLQRDHSMMVTTLEARLQDAWDRYLTSEISTSHFLKAVSNLYGPKEEH